MKNIETRKTLALFAGLLLGFCLVYAIIKNEKDIVMALVPIFAGAITWYFAKSTALDTPKDKV